MNIIQIMGNLGSDPVTRFTSSGQKVTTLNVATNLKKGENTVTVWYRVTIWGDRFDKMLSFLKKGSSIIVVGELQKPELWTDREGRSQIQLEIWADMLRFSPFGTGKGSERSPQESNAGSGGFGEQTFQGGGSQQGHSQSQHQPEEDEEKVPF
jgi:single-strand DNA-binding protein